MRLAIEEELAAITVLLDEVWPTGLVKSDPLETRLFAAWCVGLAILKKSFMRFDKKRECWTELPSLQCFTMGVWLDSAERRVCCRIRVPFDDFCSLVEGARALTFKDFGGVRLPSCMSFEPLPCFDENVWREQLERKFRNAGETNKGRESARTTTKLHEISREVHKAVAGQIALKAERDKVVDRHGFVSDPGLRPDFDASMKKEAELEKREILLRIAYKQLKAERLNGLMKEGKIGPWKWACIWPEKVPSVKLRRIEKMTKEEIERILQPFEGNFSTLGCERYTAKGDVISEYYDRPERMSDRSSNATFVCVQSERDSAVYSLSREKHVCNCDAVDFFPLGGDEGFIESLKRGDVFSINGGEWTTNGPLCHAHYTLIRFNSWQEKNSKDAKKDVIDFTKKLDRME